MHAYTWAISLINGRPEQFCKTGPSEKWWRDFKKHHHKEITLRKPDNLDRGQARMANSIVAEHHFKLLKEYWKKRVLNDFLDKHDKMF